MKEPVAGTFKITSTDRVSGAKTVITGVVTAPGLEPTPAQHTVDVPLKKLAAVYRGYDLPVAVDRTDPSRLRFIWDEVPDEKQLDLLEASRVADRMRGNAGDSGYGPGAGIGGPGVTTDFAGFPGDLGAVLGDLTHGRDVRVYTSTNTTTTSTGGEVPPEIAELARRVADQFGRAFGAPNPSDASPRDEPFEP